MLGPPAVAAREDVLDALISGKLRGLTGPRRGEGPAIQILDLGNISVLRQIWQSYGAISFYMSINESAQIKGYSTGSWPKGSTYAPTSRPRSAPVP